MPLFPMPRFACMQSKCIVSLVAWFWHVRVSSGNRVQCEVLFAVRLFVLAARPGLVNEHIS